MPRNLATLARALVETFEPGTRIVWNRAGAATRANGARPRWRIDGPHRDGGSTSPPAAPVILQVPDRTFVARIRGLADARRALNDDAWIVAVVAERPGTERSLLEDLRLLVETEPRLLVVPAGRGWTGELIVPDGTAGDDPVLDELRVWLARVRFEDRSRVLAPLEPVVAKAVPAVPTGPPIRDRVDEALLDRGLNDAHVVLVRERGATALSRFSRVFPERTFEVESIDESALSWCAGLVDGGCRLVLSVRGKTLERVVEEAAALPTGTLVVATTDSASGDVATRWLPGSEHAGRPALAALSKAFDEPHGCPLVVLVPSHEPVTRSSRPSDDGLSQLLQRCGVTPEGLRDEHERVLVTRLDGELESWCREYESVAHRTRYLWRWCRRGAALTAVPGVPEPLRSHVRDTKVLSIMLCVLLDDAADEVGDPQLVEALIGIVDQPSRVAVCDRSGSAHEEVARQLAEIYHRRIRRYPRYEEFAELLRFDQRQYFNTMRYSCLLNRQNGIVNETEHDLYLPHNMHMMSFATLDLMCLPDFDPDEVGLLREAVWEAQCMARIGNVLATWQRELRHGDVTNAFFAHAVSTGRVRPSGLGARTTREVERAVKQGGDEAYFLRKWLSYRERFAERIQRVKSVNAPDLLNNHQRFFRMHLGSRGFI